MPLPSLILDDRSFQELRDELVQRIPVYTKEWTDFNPSDPGITLLELFAFLGENLLFRFNQIPEATNLAFLKLLQIPLRPASVARAVVFVDTKDPAGSLVPSASSASAGAVQFATQTELLAWPVSVLAMCRAMAGSPAPGDEQDFAQAAIDAAGLSSKETAAYYITRTVPLDPSDPLAAAVDFEQAVDGMVWMAVIGIPAVTDLSLMCDHALNVAFVPDETVTTLDDVVACPGDGTNVSSPETVFECSTGRIDANGRPIYRVLSLDGDTSGGLTQQGIVRLRLPKELTDLGTFALSDPDLAGTRDFPPTIDDEDIAKNVLFWVRAYRRKADDRPIGRMLWIGANATEVEQMRKARPEFLGTGNAQPDQTFKLIQRPVIPGTLKLEVEEAGQFVAWTSVDGFEASTENDSHYVVDLEAGSVRFGNGVRGRAPQIGQRIRAVEYRYGGGAAGNVPAGKISKLDELSELKVKNPLPARGGGASESVAEALDRVPSELRRRDRAVTRGDFQELALGTPGANVGRAESLPLFHPPTKNLNAAGVVSVVVWPKEDRKHPNAPMPDRTLLAQVCGYLDARRLITTELYVIPPTYRKVAVAIGVTVKPGFGVEAVRRWVELVVRQFLAPLPPYGPEGRGWPLGRTVNARELEAAALQVEGVQFLTNDVGLAVFDQRTNTWIESATKQVALEPWEVPELAAITVVEGEPLSPGDAIAPPVTGLVPVPIPTLKEEC